ncbi:hypothetical protein [Gordonia paraffinivorans]|uniref:hypothetical protein n=1 Tax=Gordonia paraffinivorans TaxID=175628 RepID=UPI00215AF7A1|nr:hypothetical protein [Gordonia paraffinivorans]
MITAVEVEDLRFRHPGSTSRIEDVSFQVLRGEVACLLGPNGAGRPRCYGACSVSSNPTAGQCE